jgi:hypothetical protein
MLARLIVGCESCNYLHAIFLKNQFGKLTIQGSLFSAFLCFGCLVVGVYSFGFALNRLTLLFPYARVLT